jgi:hypothetical protein
MLCAFAFSSHAIRLFNGTSASDRPIYQIANNKYSHRHSCFHHKGRSKALIAPTATFLCVSSAARVACSIIVDAVVGIVDAMIKVFHGFVIVEPSSSFPPVRYVVFQSPPHIGSQR